MGWIADAMLFRSSHLLSSRNSGHTIHFHNMKDRPLSEMRRPSSMEGGAESSSEKVGGLIAIARCIWRSEELWLSTYVRSDSVIDPQRLRAGHRCPGLR